jgi:hypothetical protein
MTTGCRCRRWLDAGAAGRPVRAHLGTYRTCMYHAATLLSVVHAHRAPGNRPQLIQAVWKRVLPESNLRLRKIHRR